MDWLNKATKSGWPEDLKEAKPTSEIGKSPARPRQSREITKVSFRHESVKYFFRLRRPKKSRLKRKRRRSSELRKRITER